MKSICKKLVCTLCGVALLSAGGCLYWKSDPITINSTTTLEQGFENIVQEAGKKVFPAVVYIRVVRSTLEGGKEDAGIVSGSGVLITPDGEFLSNYHVVDKAREIRCLLNDGTAYPAKVLAKDKDMDIALLKLEPKIEEGKAPPVFPYAKLSTDGVKEGDFVMAMGAPWGLARSVSIGIISCSNRYLEGTGGDYTLWYQTDASISPGNSGGPLINTKGEVVGINTLGMIFGGPIAFTIPSTLISDLLGRLRQYGKVNWAWFGFQLQPLHDFDRNVVFGFNNGVMVSGTDPGSPARTAGFLPGDRIVAVGDTPVTVRSQEDMPAFRRMLGLMPFNEEVLFTIMRNGTEQILKVTPREKGVVEGDEIAFKRWGLTAKTINRFDNPNLHFYAPQGGVFVFGIDPLGNAANSQLRPQDIIQDIDGKEIKTLDDLKAVYDETIKALPGKTRATFNVSRNGRARRVILNYLDDYHKEEK